MKNLIDGARCVFTILIGKYEELNEQKVAQESNIDFLCFTDDKNLQSDTWNIIHVDPVFPYDLIRSSRIIKIAAHRYLPSTYDTSLYIDNSVTLSVPPEDIFEDLLSDDCNLYCVKHSYRETVLDEFEEVLRLNYDKSNLIIEQLNAYSMIDPELFSQDPFWSGFMLRKHKNPAIINVMEDWLAQVLCYSRRDQLSLNYVIRRYNINIKKLVFDNKVSKYHRWPTAVRYGSAALKPSLSDRIENNLRAQILTNKIRKITDDMKELESQLINKNNHIHELHTKLSEHEQKYQQQNEVLAEQHKKIEQLNTELAEEQQNFEQLNTELAEEHQIFEQLNTELAEQHRKFEQQNAELADLKEEILFYSLSKSWRFTRPLRKMMKKIQGN